MADALLLLLQYVQRWYEIESDHFEVKGKRDASYPMFLDTIFLNWDKMKEATEGL